MTKAKPQLPFFAAPMSEDALDQWENERECYLDTQIEILLTAAVDEDRATRAYREGWHMRVGMN